MTSGSPGRRLPGGAIGEDDTRSSARSAGNPLEDLLQDPFHHDQGRAMVVQLVRAWRTGGAIEEALDDFDERQIRGRRADQEDEEQRRWRHEIEPPAHREKRKNHRDGDGPKRHGDEECGAACSGRTAAACGWRRPRGPGW